MTDPTRLLAHEMAALLRSGETSSRELTEDELTLLEGQLNHILDQYAILAELSTDDIPPTAQTIELENILRDDVVQPSLPLEAVLGNAAEHDDNFVVVPAIIEER